MTQKSRPKPAQEKKQNLEDTNLLAAAEIINLSEENGAEEEDAAPAEKKSQNKQPRREPSEVDFDDENEKKPAAPNNKTLLIIVIALAVTLVVALIVVAATTNLFKNVFNSSPVYVEKVESASAVVNMKVGDSIDFTKSIIIVPSNAHSTDVKDVSIWDVSSSDDSILTVNQAQGTMQAVASGEASLRIFYKMDAKVYLFVKVVVTE